MNIEANSNESITVEKRMRVRLNSLPDHFPEELKVALKNAEVSVLSDDDVQQYARDLRGGPDNFLIPKGYVISLAKELRLNPEYILFLDQEPRYIFFYQTWCTRI